MVLKMNQNEWIEKVKAKCQYLRIDFDKNNQVIGVICRAAYDHYSKRIIKISGRNERPCNFNNCKIKDL